LEKDLTLERFDSICDKDQTFVAVQDVDRHYPGYVITYYKWLSMSYKLLNIL